MKIDFEITFLIHRLSKVIHIQDYYYVNITALGACVCRGLHLPTGSFEPDCVVATNETGVCV